ncbi:MAG: anhydro-N-acetylmuramic acid kinase [Cyclobacteriaceae bacterium]
MKSISRYKVIGAMSGTSLDGLDLVYCEFIRSGKKWSFKLKASQTVRYSRQWQKRLALAHLLSGEKLQLLDIGYGVFIGDCCNKFRRKNELRVVNFIASHGHTIFHQPENRLTFQLGNGGAINSTTGLPVVNDFRSIDVLKGGQGAPLVPVGDHLLFSAYDICLNLGGIANLSRIEGGKRTAFDICFVNMGLNHLAAKLGKKYDKSGKEASIGDVDKKMLNSLNGAYAKWRKKRPSLGREGFEEYIEPIIEDEAVPIRDRLRTFCESIAIEISKSMAAKKKKKKSVLATGGGALNSFLIKLIADKLGPQFKVTVPASEIINYKEAIVFALLGILRTRNETNILKSVTGAESDSSGGVMTGF